MEPNPDSESNPIHGIRSNSEYDDEPTATAIDHDEAVQAQPAESKEVEQNHIF